MANDKANLLVRAMVHRGSKCTLDVDLKLSAQGVTAVLGPSGSGKTTLLRAIAGLDRPDPGFIALGDLTWQDQMHPAETRLWVAPHRRCIGVVFQEASLFEHLSVAGNIKFGYQRVAPGKRHISLDRAVELTGVGSLMDRSVQQLSGGERQRVAIARTLAASPVLLLLDEPLASQDVARKAELLPYFEQLARQGGIPILYVTHAIEEAARLSNHLLLLESGRCTALGDTAQILGRLDVAQTQGEGAGAILDGVVQECDLEYGLMTVRFGLDGRGLIHCLQTNPALKTDAHIRLRILARDVSVALSLAEHSSIINIVPAAVMEMKSEGSAQVLLSLNCFGSVLLARITRKSCDALGLAVGSVVYAQIKAVAVLE